jgi:hypothetical protein
MSGVPIHGGTVAPEAPARLARELEAGGGGRKTEEEVQIVSLDGPTVRARACGPPTHARS